VTSVPRRNMDWDLCAARIKRLGNTGIEHGVYLKLLRSQCQNCALNIQTAKCILGT